MDARDDANAVDWSLYRWVTVDVAMYVDVEVADHDLLVIEVVVVDDVVVMDDEPAQTRGAKQSTMLYLCCWNFTLLYNIITSTDWYLGLSSRETLLLANSSYTWDTNSLLGYIPNTHQETQQAF